MDDPGKNCSSCGFSRCSLLDIILNDVPEEKLVALGAVKKIEWDGDDKCRILILPQDAYILNIIKICPGFEGYPFVTFERNGSGYRASTSIKMPEGYKADQSALLI